MQVKSPFNTPDGWINGMTLIENTYSSITLTFLRSCFSFLDFNHLAGYYMFLKVILLESMPLVIAVVLFIQLLVLKYVMREHQPFNIVNWPKKNIILYTVLMWNIVESDLNSPSN